MKTLDFNPLRDALRLDCTTSSDFSECFSAPVNYLFLITGRCGSTWLHELLRSARCGDAFEYFAEDAAPHFMPAKADFAGYCRHISEKRSLDGVFGAQIDGDRLRFLSDLIDVQSTFNRFRLIIMTRKNVIAQAFSYARARKTGVWHVRDGVRPPEVPISDAEVFAEIESIRRKNEAINDFVKISGRKALRITYEDMCMSRAETFVRVHEWITDRLPQHIPADTTQRLAVQSDAEAAFIMRNWRNLQRDLYVHDEGT